MTTPETGQLAYTKTVYCQDVKSLTRHFVDPKEAVTYANTLLALIYHPGGGEHPPAIMIRGQLGAVVVALDRLPLLCGNLMALHHLYRDEGREDVGHIMNVMETKND